MKPWYICILLLIFASCSRQRYLDNVSLGNQGKAFANSLSPQDSVKFLFQQTRYGEAAALLLSQKPTVKDITAKEYGVLDSLGARNILEYYKEGGDIHLTDDDIRRLEIICRTATFSKTVAQEYEASLWDNKVEICPLADKELIDTCYEVLDRNMMLETDGMYGQIAVVDATSSKVLAWASLENTREEGEEYGDIAYVPFKNNVCTRNILATFYDTNLTRQIRDAERSSNAIELAMSFNQMRHQRLPLDFINKNALGKYNSLQYNDGKCTLDEFTFVGCLPANNPKYTVSMVVIRPHKLPIYDGLLTKEVNVLVEWLINRNSQR